MQPTSPLLYMFVVAPPTKTTNRISIGAMRLRNFASAKSRPRYSGLRGAAAGSIPGNAIGRNASYRTNLYSDRTCAIPFSTQSTIRLSSFTAVVALPKENWRTKTTITPSRSTTGISVGLCSAAASNTNPIAHMKYRVGKSNQREAFITGQTKRPKRRRVSNEIVFHIAASPGQPIEGKT